MTIKAPEFWTTESDDGKIITSHMRIGLEDGSALEFKQAVSIAGVLDAVEEHLVQVGGDPDEVGSFFSKIKKAVKKVAKKTGIAKVVKVAKKAVKTAVKVVKKNPLALVKAVAAPSFMLSKLAMKSPLGKGLKAITNNPLLSKIPLVSLAKANMQGFEKMSAVMDKATKIVKQVARKPARKPVPVPVRRLPLPTPPPVYAEPVYEEPEQPVYEEPVYEEPEQTYDEEPEQTYDEGVAGEIDEAAVGMVANMYKTINQE
jgi:ElaB/YqjD/DUF883 family membrane-anchored ribosome-binding protein